MSDVKTLKRGVTLEPQSSDPVGPVEGQLQMSDGSHRAAGLWRYDGTAWQAVGSGGGGLDVLFTETFETTNAADFTTGQGPTFDVDATGFGGALSDVSSGQISGDASVKYVTNATPASSDNDFFHLAPITLDPKHKGNDVGLTFYYTSTIADDLVEVVLYDDTNNNVLTSTLDLLKEKGNPTRYSTTAFIPTSCNAIKIGFHHTGVSEASKELVIDDIELSSAPFIFAEFNQENEFSAVIANPSGTATIQSESESFIQSVSRSAQGVVAVVFKPNFFSVIPTIVAVAHSVPNSSSLDIDPASISTSGFTTVVVNPSGTTVDSTFSFLCQRQGSDYKDAVKNVVTPAKNVTETGRWHTNAGLGSTNNKIPYFSTEVEDSFSALGIVDHNNATDGFSFTALEDCIVEMKVTGMFTTQGRIGISLNSSELTTQIGNIITADRVAGSLTSDSAFAQEAVALVRLSAGDILRPHTDTAVANSLAEWQVQIIARPTEVTFLAAVPVQKTGYIHVAAGDQYHTAPSATTSYKTQNLDHTSGDDTFFSIDSDQLRLDKGKYTLIVPVGADGASTWIDLLLHDATLTATIETLEQVAFSNVSSESVFFSDIHLSITLTTTKLIEFRTKAGAASGNEYMGRITVTKLI